MTHHDERDMDPDFAAEAVAERIYALGVSIGFNTSVERYPAERYSWGGSRGMETTPSAQLRSLKIGEHLMDRAEAVRIFGKEWVEDLESRQVARNGEAA